MAARPEQIRAGFLHDAKLAVATEKTAAANRFAFRFGEADAHCFSCAIREAKRVFVRGFDQHPAELCREPAGEEQRGRTILRRVRDLGPADVRELFLTCGCIEKLCDRETH